MKFSIIIPVKQLNDYIDESMSFIRQMNYRNFEVLIIVDQPEKKSHFAKATRDKKIAGARIIVSSDPGPAFKRDLGAKKAKGEALAFLDDDAYPTKNWLKIAAKDFRDPAIAALGGPALTPKNEPFKAKLSAVLFESLIGGGNLRFRYLPLGRKREINDWPSVNLLVRKDIFQKVGGFNCQYWPGEDTKLCLDILATGKKIIYDPDLRVFHHRRASLFAHFKQVGNYALHRGFFAKKYPKTSLKLFYFFPTLFVLYLIAAAFCVYFRFSVSARPSLDGYGMLAVAPFVLYLLLLVVDDFSAVWRSRGLSVLSYLGILSCLPILIFATNVWYGIRFVWGLLSSKLAR